MVPRVARGVSLKCTRPQTWSPSVLGYRGAFKTRPGCGCTLIATGLNRGTALSCRDNTLRCTNYSLQAQLRPTAGAKRRLFRDKREELWVAGGAAALAVSLRSIDPSLAYWRMWRWGKDTSRRLTPTGLAPKHRVSGASFLPTLSPFALADAAPP